jgi:hypothetical protein
MPAPHQQQMMLTGVLMLTGVQAVLASRSHDQQQQMWMMLT